MRTRKIVKFLIFAILILLMAGYCLPQKFAMPVAGAGRSNFDPHSFWAYPWGPSITHKGVDIFSPAGTNVMSATAGIVIYTGSYGRGGNVVMVIGPKWRTHYYAHLKEKKTGIGSWVEPGELIGTVGNTGNAAGKPPHLHYSIRSIVPLPWRIDHSRQGWKKMFYLDPVPYLAKNGQ